MADIGINEMNDEMTFDYTFEKMNELFGKINSSEVFTTEEKQNIKNCVTVADSAASNNSAKLKLGANGSELYFHGSTSPNIPVLKKKTVKNSINLKDSTIPYMVLGLKDTNAIVLSVTANMYSSDGIGTVTCRPFTGQSGSWYSYIEGSISNTGIENKNIQVTVYYLEIPTDYEFPSDETTIEANEVSDENMGII